MPFANDNVIGRGGSGLPPHAGEKQGQQTQGDDAKQSQLAQSLAANTLS
ncbi:MAG: hypothetical protein AAB217_23790 [Chloroflexota bacterium]